MLVADCFHIGLWTQGRDPERDTITPQEERIPISPGGRPLSTKAGIIDLDMNERNVMIGDYDTLDPAPGGHSHNQVPIFKVGDLGLAVSFRERQFQEDFNSLVRFVAFLLAPWTGTSIF